MCDFSFMIIFSFDIVTLLNILIFFLLIYKESHVYYCWYVSGLCVYVCVFKRYNPDCFFMFVVVFKQHLLEYYPVHVPKISSNYSLLTQKVRHSECHNVFIINLQCYFLHGCVWGLVHLPCLVIQSIRKVDLFYVAPLVS